MARRASFQPRFTLALLYFFGFFFAFSLLLAAPALLEVARSVEPGPAQQQAAEEATRRALAGRLPWAVGAAVVTVGGLIWARVLPGLRPD